MTLAPGRYTVAVLAGILPTLAGIPGVTPIKVAVSAKSGLARLGCGE